MVIVDDDLFKPASDQILIKLGQMGTVVYGYDAPQELAKKSGFLFTKEHDMTPQRFIDEIQGAERFIFKYLFAGNIAKSMYRMYEFKKAQSCL